MLKLKDTTPQLSFKNKTLQLSFKDIVECLKLKDETLQLSFNLKIYTSYHIEYFKLLELFDSGG